LPDWEELFSLLPAPQRTELIELAKTQGVVYSHQLPVHNAVPHRHSDFLPRLLSSEFEPEPSRPQPIEVFDTELDPIQKEAVARAIHTTDLCLIRGLPGSGKSRVAEEIIAQAVARGERVLVMAPTPAVLDHLLEQLLLRPSIVAVRCLEKEESIDRLPEKLRSCTFMERARSLIAEWERQAQETAAALQERLLQLRGNEKAWAALAALARAREALETKERLLADERRDVRERVSKESSEPSTSAGTSFSDAIRACRSDHERHVGQDAADLMALRSELKIEEEKLAKMSARLAELEPFRIAKKKSRWWTLIWWQATLRPGWGTRWAEANSSCETIQSVIAQLRTRVGDAETRRLEQERTFRQMLDCIVSAEVQRREAVIRRQQDEIAQVRVQLRRDWQIHCDPLCDAAIIPKEFTVAAVQLAEADWRALLEIEARRHALSRDWAQFVAARKGQLPSLLPHYVNVVAATPTSLKGDPYFGEHLHNGRTRPLEFDRLVLEDADHFMQPELTAIARRSLRWALFARHVPVISRNSSEAGRTSIPRHLLSTFDKLWEKLHCDPCAKLPCVWVQEPDRLLCRLRSVPPDQKRWLESEPVADCPHIELRILSVPGAPPVLAEVAFPAQMSIERAKQYIHDELEELTVSPGASNLRWAETTDRLTLAMSHNGDQCVADVMLRNGVQERVATSSSGIADGSKIWRTAAIEFDKTQAWDRQRAEEWIHRHLGIRDSGRTILLERVHRADGGLQPFVYHMLGASFPDSDQGAGTASVVEFVPVPAPHSGGSRSTSRRTSDDDAGSLWTNSFTSRGGAGLEADLAGIRRSDRLPIDLAEILPRNGIVNYFEAQAVAQKLTSLTTTTETACQATSGCTGKHRPVVGVIAFSAAQVRLIQTLVERVPPKTIAHLNLRIGRPEELAQTEFDIVLISLTRSHTHRAVAYAATPQDWVRALTCGRKQIIIFGDPGNLVRRTQWHGGLDELNEVAANRERELATRLVRYLQKHDRGYRASSARQSIGT
jgi:hypothetical protein